MPENLLDVVDAMLEKAVRASEVAIDAAHGEAEFVIATALAERAELRRRAGVEPDDHAAIGPLERQLVVAQYGGTGLPEGQGQRGLPRALVAREHHP